MSELQQTRQEVLAGYVNVLLYHVCIITILPTCLYCYLILIHTCMYCMYDADFVPPYC